MRRERLLVGQTGVVASFALLGHLVEDVVPVRHGVEHADTALLGAAEDGVRELPDAAPGGAVTEGRDGGEVVEHDAADHPSTARETGPEDIVSIALRFGYHTNSQVGGRLQQPTDAPSSGGTRCPAIGSSHKATAVHQRSIATTRSGDGDVG